MKKILLTLIALIMTAGLVSADFKTYSVAASSYPVTEAMTADIQGDIRIGKIIISNTDDTALQTVTLYKLGNSSTTATAVMTVNFGAGDTNTNQIIEYQQSDMFPVHDLAIRRSVETSSPTVTIQYR